MTYLFFEMLKLDRVAITFFEIIAPLDIFAMIFDVVVEIASDSYGKNESCTNPEWTCKR